MYLNKVHSEHPSPFLMNISPEEHMSCISSHTSSSSSKINSLTSVYRQCSSISPDASTTQDVRMSGVKRALFLKHQYGMHYVGERVYAPYIYKTYKLLSLPSLIFFSIVYIILRNLMFYNTFTDCSFMVLYPCIIYTMVIHPSIHFHLFISVSSIALF